MSFFCFKANFKFVNQYAVCKFLSATAPTSDTMILKTVGLIGLLVLAKQKHKIEAVRPYMDILIRNDYRISVKLYNQILGMAKEI